MRRWIYKHPFLFELLTILPVFFVCSLADHAWNIGISIYILFFAYATIMIMQVGSIGQRIHREATYKLDCMCDPDGFLSDIDFLLGRGMLPPRQRFRLLMEHATGMDAQGRYAEALAEMQRLWMQNYPVGPLDKLIFRAQYATLLLHVGKDVGEVPAHIEELEQVLANGKLPQPLAQGLGAYVETIRDQYRFVRGEYSGLRERYVQQVESCRRNPMQRRMLIQSCMRLGRLYEKLGRREEALGLYRFVVQNGNRLGSVKEAAALCAAWEASAKSADAEAPVCFESDAGAE